MQAAKIAIVIPEDHRVELELPSDLPVGPAEVIVLIAPKPAEVHAAQKRPRRPLGLDVGKGWIAEDFDAPLPDEIQRAFEGGENGP